MPSLDQIQSLLAREPDDAFLNFALAMELARQQRTDDAVAQFDRVIALNTHYTPAHFQKGRTLLNAGRLDDARSALQTGIERALAIGESHAADEMRELLDSIV